MLDYPPILWDIKKALTIKRLYQGGGPLPRLKSSKKRMRQSQKGQLRNKAVRSLLRTTIKKVQMAPNKAEAQALLPQAQSIIDKTLKKGVVHRNAAARYKSRLLSYIGKME